MSKATKETTEIVIRLVPHKTKRNFKAKCCQEGYSMRDKIVDMMEKWVAGN